MSKVPLGREKFAIVDAEDLPWIAATKWYAATSGHVVGRVQSSGEVRRVHLHALVLDFPKSVYVVHVNGDKLDCRKANLRMVSRAEAAGQSWRYRSEKASAHPGVTPSANGRRWKAQLWVKQPDGSRRMAYLGTFDTEEQAITACSLFQSPEGLARTETEDSTES